MTQAQLIDNLIDGLLEATSIALAYARAHEKLGLTDLLEEISSEFDPVDSAIAMPSCN